MARIPQRFIDDLLDRADIVDIVGSRLDLRKSGKNYSARCPFHDEKTPSFSVSPDKQFYYCFGCGAGGNAIGFVMDFDRIEFPQAVEKLAHHCGLEVPKEASNEGPGDAHRKKLYNIIDEADRYYRTQLRNHPEAKLAINYLKTRGLTGAITQSFGISFAPPGWDNLITALGDNDDRVKLLIEAGLVIRKDDNKNRVYDRFRHRIIFPIRDTRGRTIGFGGRVLDDSKPKYLNSPETPTFHKGRELYGLYEAHRDLREIPSLVVVEGYMDVVALAQHGIHNAVATLGTAATEEHLNKLFRYTSEVIFCFDGDSAGRKAAHRAMETSLPVITDGRSARFLFLPEGEDPDTQVRKLGAEGFNKLLANAQPLSDFLFSALENDLNMGSVDGKARLSKLAAPLINRMADGVYRQLLLKELARRTDMDVDNLQAIIVTPPKPAEEEDFNNPDTPSDYPSPDYDNDYHYESEQVPPPDHMPNQYQDEKNQARPNPQISQRKKLKLPPVHRLILLLLHNPALHAEMELLAELESHEDSNIQLLINLRNLLRENPDYTLNHILGYWRGIYGAEQGELLTRIVASDLLKSPAHTPRDNLTEFRDICQYLQKRLHLEHSPQAQLDRLLAKEALTMEERKQLTDLTLNQLTEKDRTPEINTLIKQLLAKPAPQKIK